jgi:N-acylglucosamine 2-epimerase
MAHAARMAARGAARRCRTTELLHHARTTADFLLRHAFLDDGAVAYLLTADGAKKEFLPGKGHDLSFFGDGFVILALAGVARATGEAAYLERALARTTAAGAPGAGRVRSEPYPLPPGCRAHAWPMIMLNVAQELERALARLRPPAGRRARRRRPGRHGRRARRLRPPDGLVQEVVCDDGRPGLLTEHVTPGHAIESMWFVMEQAARHGRPDAIEKAARVVERSFEAGWDPVHGGLFRYVVPGGPAPTGRRTVRSSA